jgi:Leucine-rich repeat (LRR) protein
MTQNLTGIFIKFFIFCLLTATLTTDLALSASISTSKGFCEVYKCYCPKPEEEIKCKFNNTVKSVDFVDPSVEKVDFSGSSLERFVFGDTTLSIKSLILSYNSISEIHENAFDKLPHLQYLDLSNNQISLVQEVAFTSLNVLASLNLSRAFKADYKISRDICELINLKVLDLSYADLDDLTFECWKTAHLVELYLSFTKNVEKSWQNWFPYIGTSLKLIDLSNSDIINLDSSLSTKMLSLTSLNLANNKNLDKSSLFTLLGENKLIERIEYLNISNIGAWSKSLNINQLLSNANSTSISLSVLDVSHNKYNDDLNVFLFNQQKLSKLKVFIASNNQFTTCNSKLIAGTDATLLTSLEEINLASNFLNGSSCLYPLKPVKTLKKLDLRNNKLSLISTEFKSDNFISFFADKPGLKYVDFSSNQFIFFILYMNPNHTFVEKLDFSSNHLKSFRFLSMTKVNSAKFPTNLYENRVEKNTKKQPDSPASNGASSDSGDDDDDYDYNETYDYGNEYADEDDEAIIETHSSDDYDDDQRFIYINELNLSRNKFSIVNVQHMLQSIRNVYDFDLSYNPILQVVGLSGDPLLTNKVIYKNITDTKMKSLNNQLNNTKLTSQMASIVDLIAATYKNNPNGPLQEALCIDLLDLGNCKIKRLPNLQHTCINKGKFMVLI